jgi:hypothetical protein
LVSAAAERDKAAAIARRKSVDASWEVDPESARVVEAAEQENALSSLAGTMAA